MDHELYETLWNTELDYNIALSMGEDYADYALQLAGEYRELEESAQYENPMWEEEEIECRMNRSLSK